MKVLVTDGSARAALAITRSLGRLEHEVLVGEKHGGSLAHASRYCRRRVVYPDPVSAPDEFVDFLATLVVDEAVEVLIPVTDIATMLITRNRARFNGCAIPFAEADLIDRAANKVDIVRTAERLGVPVPRSAVVRHAADLPSQVEFPVVIKPWQSRVRVQGGWMSSSVSYADNRDQLLQDLDRRPVHEFPVMLQELIEGPGVGVFACYHRGKAVALFSHRRLRERPPWGGVSVLSESVALPPVAAMHATRLLDELQWHGVAMVEFKHDVRDNLPKLMEINGRFWGSLQLAIDAGVNFPALLMDSIGPPSAEPQKPYRTGIRNRWFWGDVDSLLVTLFGGNGAPRGSRRSKLVAVAQFTRVWGRSLHYDNPKWDDPWPWVVETLDWFRRVATNAMAHGRAGARRLSAASTRNGGAPAAAAGGSRAAASSRPVTRTVRSLEQTGVEAEAWNALASRGATNTVFQTYEWTRSWWSTFGNQCAPLFVAAHDAAGVAAGVGAFVVEQPRSRHRLLRFMGDLRADYCDIVAPSGDQAVAEAIVDAVLDSPDWDTIELNNLPAASPSADLVVAACARRGFPIIKEDRFFCPTLLIEGHEAEARAIFDKQSLRRRQNYFERSGKLTARHLTRFDEIEVYLDRFFAQHVSRWSTTGSPSLFLDKKNRAFYRRLAANVSARGWLLFSVIEFEGQPIAIHYGFDYEGTVTWYKPTFDVAHADHSPGLVLVRQLIGYAIDRQRTELDFTLGDEPFKTRFTNSMRKTVRIQIFRSTRGLIVERARRRLAKAVRKVSGH